MSFNIFNVKNHSLNAEMRIKIDGFSTDNFGGILSTEEPIDISTTPPSFVEDSTLFLCAGRILEAANVTLPAVNSSSNLAYLEVVFNEEADNITTDVTSNISVKTAQSTITPHVVEDEETGEELGEYYSFTLGGNEYDYMGQAVLVDGKYIIPLYDATYGLLVWYKDKSSLESFLSAAAYAALKKYIEENFVWRVGGTTKGDVGNLNVTGNKIAGIHGNGTVILQRPCIDLTLPQTRKTDYIAADTYIRVTDTGEETVYTDWAVQPNHGGIGNSAHRDQRGDARQILGIFSGTADPNVASLPYTVSDGDIYFKIIE